MSDRKNLDKMTEIETGIGEEKRREMLIDKESENESGNVREITKRRDKGPRPQQRRKGVVKEAIQEKGIRRHKIKIEGMIKRIGLTEKPLTGRIEVEMMREEAEIKTEIRTEIVNRLEIKGMRSLQTRVKSLKIFAPF